MSDSSPAEPSEPLPNGLDDTPGGFLSAIIRFTLEKRLVVGLLFGVMIVWGILVSPFGWTVGGLPRDSVAVDALPDIGENQQIVFTEWAGQSPQDVEDQLTYPLSVALLGIPGVKNVRSTSLFGFSSIYLIFEEGVDFYWCRSRILEKLSSLPAGTIPENVHPALGPDATALGQVYWYTLEGLDPEGNATGGWDLHELRSIQDWYVRYALSSAEGISEVASVGGFVQEYQIDVDPDAMHVYGVTLEEIFHAVRMSNQDVGARTIEINSVEYVIRGLGLLKGIEDLESTVVKVVDNVPVRIQEVATIALGPALRRGALDKAGAETVGGVAVVRYGYNPLEAIGNIKAKAQELRAGLPSKVLIDYSKTNRQELVGFAGSEAFPAYKGGELNEEAWTEWLKSHPMEDWPAGVTLSQLSIVPFYDRTELIHETLDTLGNALELEILVACLVATVMLLRFRPALLVVVVLPVAVLLSFIAMKLLGVQANLVALGGIAIAIGTVVDMGIVVSESITRKLDEHGTKTNRLRCVFDGTRDVAGAVLTATATTVIGFLPVFTMTGAEGKLFRPLAYTKTFALGAAVIVALLAIPPADYLILRPRKVRPETGKPPRGLGLFYLVIALLFLGYTALRWRPLGEVSADIPNLIFVTLAIGGFLLLFLLFERLYPRILAATLRHKLLFLSLPTSLVVLAACIWLGFHQVFSFVPKTMEAVGLASVDPSRTLPWQRLGKVFPGLGSEFMPPLDEGSFLLMPTTMPHASIGEALDVLQYEDRAFTSLPEVEIAVGKLGRAETALDPAPVSMIETVIQVAPEYQLDDDGNVPFFRYDRKKRVHVRDENGELIPDPSGRPFRNWRDHIKSVDDIWMEILDAMQLPGTTSAPRLQPIGARQIMLQSGIRAPMGVKIKGSNLMELDRTAMQVEALLKEVPGVAPLSAFADRIVGKPYLEIDLDREALAQFGLHVGDVQEVIQVAIGGRTITHTIEGRERYPVRVRYKRELRSDPEAIQRILVPTPQGAQIPLGDLAEVRYHRGPQSIKSEDTFLVNYVLFDKQDGFAEVDVVENCAAYLEEKVESGELQIPPGVSFSFTGNYENQVRAQKTLSVVIPLALVLILIILYLQFSSLATTLFVFSGVLVAWAGGFLLLWLYGRPWFLDFKIVGLHIGDLFQVGTVNLSVAVWVGFLALFGIATDDGVLMATYIEDSVKKRKGELPSREEVRELIVSSASRRIRPALTTTATTVLALLPVLFSSGRGSDLLIPMALPSFGGMLVAILTVFVVPVLYSWRLELRVRRAARAAN